jgi:ATP synthase protein I
MQARGNASSRALRRVLRWQALATVLLALLGGLAAGAHGALSAALGGAVSVAAGWLSAQVAERRNAASAGGAVARALAAEGVKIGVIVLLLWLVLSAYREVVVIAFLGSFMVTVLLFSMAFFVRATD